MQFRVLSLLAVIYGLVLAAAPAQAQSERIAAIVNDTVISTSDLNGRLSLALAALNLPRDQETQRRLLPRVMRDLINEQLQIQEAQRLNIDITDEEIATAFEAIAQQNGMSAEAFIRQLNQDGITANTLLDQIRAQIAWSRVIQRTIQREIEITEDDIAAVQERLEANSGQSEYLLAEIFLPVDNPREEAEVLALAERLVRRIREGADFPSIARQFSQSAGAARGGDLGWIAEDQLSDPVREVVQQMSRLSLSPPIRDVTGYRIIALRDRRNPSSQNAMLGLRQLFVPLDEESGQHQSDLASALRGQIDSCDLMDRAVEANPHPLSGDVGEVQLADLPQPVQDILSEAPIGELTEPVARPDGLLLFMVCSREDAPSQLPTPDEIANNLAMERMEILQRRYIRDLRAAAFIDIRISG